MANPATFRDELHFETYNELEWRDLTGEVRDCLARSGLRDGLLVVSAVGSTASIVTIEAEDGLRRDLLHLAERFAPRAAHYDHNDRWQDGNGHSHLRATLLGSSVCVPFNNGELEIGTWQQIVFVEFDVRPRRRTVVVQGVGVAAG
jgi:secondary thiamine-phosphate synthase enzyme